MLDYYDQILLAIAAVMIAGTAVGLHPLVEFHQGLASGSLVATLFLYEILFRNPPTEPTTSTTAASVVVGSSWLLTLMLSL
ncbi:hypothetical protein HLASF_0509 [Halanaeroarchaeum sulfurireducens]|uniref:Uncharacterized protein n=1 Tax=Halanaeroarchaeum sulfurireducens TaxID=1604004 RepID=A0A0F7PCD2_9EURY|nr:hypothetical protein HLASF_0509 [Halanaeroarchaeum sulfurireducens]ALG81409.1 hypothetical protein HLASA_0506 [Halanaeroarchaeum sulfurireducens]